MPTGTAIAAASLWLLQYSPASIRQPVLDILRRLPFAINPDSLSTFLKGIVALGLLANASSAASDFALNNWRLSSDAERWNWAEEIAVVTGGCSGIGEEITRALAAKGVKVVVLDVTAMPDRLKDAVALYIKCDVTDSEAIDNAAEEIRKKLGNPSILVNNAGIGFDIPMLDIPPNRVKKLIDVNLTSHWYTLRAFGRSMVQNNKGHIIEIASMSSFVSPGNISVYAATKAALVSFAESLREQLRNHYRAPNVHVTIVHPLWVATPLIAEHQDKIEKVFGKSMSPSVVGHAVAQQVFACRGAQLVIPKSWSLVRTVRAWPVWIVDLIKGSGGSAGEEAGAAQVGSEGKKRD